MIVIFGKGKVGKGLQKLLNHLNIDHILMDDKDLDEQILIDAEKIITSPGIKKSHLLYAKFSGKVFSELTFLGNLIQNKGWRKNFEFIGVTGTNGKSTVSHVLYNIFTKLFPDNNIYLSGNFDIPFSQTILEIITHSEFGSTDVKFTIILECSSFMLYNLQYFDFDLSIWTNIALDHLDWHTHKEEYFEAKLQLPLHTKGKSFISEKLVKQIKNTSINHDDISWYKDEYDISYTQFLGDHNKGNLQACFLLVQTYIQKNNIHIPQEMIHNIIKQIPALDHRMKLVKEIHGIKIYDDGICTSSQALHAALSCFDDPVVLIAGGYDKGDEYAWLSDDFKNHVAYVSLMGQIAPKLADICKKNSIPQDISHNFSVVVQRALNYAKQHNISTVLFSPGAASFDMFHNVYDRVDQFLKLIKKN